MQSSLTSRGYHADIRGRRNLIGATDKSAKVILPRLHSTPPPTFSNLTVGGGLDAGSPITFSHVSAGENRELLIFIDFGGLNAVPIFAITSVTYNGVAASFVDSQLSNGTLRGAVHLYHLTAPAIGTNNVVVTYTNTTTSASDVIRVYAVSYTDVDQTTPYSNVTKNSGSSAAPTVTQTSAAGRTTVVGVVDGSAITSVNQTLRVIRNDNSSSGGGNSAVAEAVGATSVTTTWAAGNDDWGIVSLSLNPVAAGGVATTVGSSTGLGVASGNGIDANGGTISTVGSSTGLGVASGNTQNIVQSVGSSTGLGVASGNTRTVSTTVGSSTGLGDALGNTRTVATTIGSSTGVGTALGNGATASGVVSAVGNAVGTSTVTGNAIDTTASTESNYGGAQFRTIRDAITHELTSRSFAVVRAIVPEVNTEIILHGSKRQAKIPSVEISLIPQVNTVVWTRKQAKGISKAGKLAPTAEQYSELRSAKGGSKKIRVIPNVSSSLDGLHPAKIYAKTYMMRPKAINNPSDEEIISLVASIRGVRGRGNPAALANTKVAASLLELIRTNKR